MTERPSGGGGDGGPLGRSPRGKRSTGKIVRDALLLFVILAMGLPFLVARVGEADVPAGQEELVRVVRRAAFQQQDWLSNSLANKVVEAGTEADGTLRVRLHYYTFFGLPWGWSEATVAADGQVRNLRTGLTLQGLF
ncbi:MAG: hypothetical protein M5U22_05170 [Thermoleophilia bacterium]|nr:hypothetical protein [Thermoleophilia bacterium]